MRFERYQIHCCQLKGLQRFLFLRFTKQTSLAPRLSFAILRSRTGLSSSSSSVILLVINASFEQWASTREPISPIVHCHSRLVIFSSMLQDIVFSSLQVTLSFLMRNIVSCHISVPYVIIGNTLSSNIDLEYSNVNDQTLRTVTTTSMVIYFISLVRTVSKKLKPTAPSVCRTMSVGNCKIFFFWSFYMQVCTSSQFIYSMCLSFRFNQI